VSNDNVHAPTSAGPVPAGGGIVATGPQPGTGTPSSPLERPEVLVGAAFAGGLLAALILKRLGH
jgi:hypothetical protein